MAYSAINSTEVEVGAPIKKELWDKVKDNLADHETRIAAQEVLTVRLPLIDAEIVNATSTSATMSGILHVRIPQDITLTECFVQIYEKGSLGGELEIDIKRNTSQNDTGMTTVFTTKPKITYASASDYDESTNQVFDGAQVALTEGEWVRLDVTELPTGGTVGKFYVVLFGEVA